MSTDSSRGARFNSSRGMGSFRGRGSWRPLVRTTSSRFGNMGGIVYYWCGVEGHIARDCPMPWADKFNQCRQQGHIPRNCT